MKDVRALLEKHGRARARVREFLNARRILEGMAQERSGVGTALNIPHSEVRAEECRALLLVGTTQDRFRALRSESRNAILDAVAADHGINYTELLAELDEEVDQVVAPVVEALLSPLDPSWIPGVREALLTAAVFPPDAIIASVMGAVLPAAAATVCDAASQGFIVCGFASQGVQVCRWSRLREVTRIPGLRPS